MNAVAGIGNEQHVALVDGGPSANARTVDAEAFFEGVFGQLADGIGDVLLQTGQIGEAQIHLVHFFLFGKLQHFLGVHGPPWATWTGFGR